MNTRRPSTLLLADLALTINPACQQLGGQVQHAAGSGRTVVEPVRLRTD